MGTQTKIKIVISFVLVLLDTLVNYGVLNHIEVTRTSFLSLPGFRLSLTFMLIALLFMLWHQFVAKEMQYVIHIWSERFDSRLRASKQYPRVLRAYVLAVSGVFLIFAIVGIIMTVVRHSKR